MRAALDIAVTQEVWAQAAKRASSLSAIQLVLGLVAEAKAAGKTAVEHADMSADDCQRLVNRTILADALHQSGAIEEARILFADTERIHPKCQPDYPRLYSIQGYRYCELLLTLGQAEATRVRAEQALD